MAYNKQTELKKKFQNVVIDKQGAVGGSGGIMFDSGCNLSGVSNIIICLGPYECDFVGYHTLTIKRIFLEFETPSQESEHRSPSYDGFQLNDTHVERTFKVDASDPIVQIDVWTTESVANAIRFHLKSGLVSDLYGSPTDPSKPPTCFNGNHSGWKLVGVHGSYGGLIDKLGFTFAMVVPDDKTSICYPPSTAELDGLESLTIVAQVDDKETSQTEASEETYQIVP